MSEISLFLVSKIHGGDIFDQDDFSADKVFLIHPFSAQINLKMMISEKKQVFVNVIVPLVEIEFSFRQMFHIRFMLDQIIKECAPLISLAKHLKQS